jgi:hypothetical protein
MSLPDELNYFYARFEAGNAVPDDCVITLSAADVSKTFKQATIDKAAGTDGLPGRVPEHALINWKVFSPTFSTSPCLSL